jgi:hypothetical protein
MARFPYAKRKIVAHRERDEIAIKLSDFPVGTEAASGG